MTDTGVGHLGHLLPILASLKLYWSHIPQRGMTTLSIVEDLGIVKDVLLRLFMRLVDAILDPFSLKLTEEAFFASVVPAVVQ